MNRQIKAARIAFSVFLYFFIANIFSQQPPKISEEILALQIHEKVNEERLKAGLNPLEWNEKLAVVAKLHSEDMAKNGFFDYINLKDEDPIKRAEKYGVICAKNLGSEVVTGIAENLFKDSIYKSIIKSKENKKYVFKTSEEIASTAVSGLMRKNENKENILAKEYLSEGIGVAIDKEGNVLITQDFCIGNFKLTEENQKPNIDPILLAKKIHELVNKEREKRRMKKLDWNDELVKIALSHSEDMAKRNYFAHKTPEGKDPTERAKEKGFLCQKKYGSYIRSGIGENIFQNHIFRSATYIGDKTYYDYRSFDEIAESTVEGWMKSEGHRENILDLEYDSEGIGIVISDSGEIYITQNFC
ncbi:MAG: CAP domain-containing protein [Acidobacteria bacterium]|nr:CAP domain-containing protein [Acidobacteriota bacterium]